MMLETSGSSDWISLGGTGSPGAEQRWTRDEEDTFLGIRSEFTWVQTTLRREEHKTRFVLTFDEGGLGITASVPSHWLQRSMFAHKRRLIWQFEATESGTALGGIIEADRAAKQRIVFATGVDAIVAPMLLCETSSSVFSFKPAMTVARVPRVDRSRPLLVPLSSKLASFDEHVLECKRPAWNRDHRAFELGFIGRRATTSIKNFQLISSVGATANSSNIVLQFGRLDGNTFSLDFCKPLCALQAFGIALAHMSCL